MSNVEQELQKIREAIEQGFGVVDSYAKVLLEMAQEVIKRNLTKSEDGSFQAERILAEKAQAKAVTNTTAVNDANRSLRNFKPSITGDAFLTTMGATPTTPTPVSNSPQTPVSTSTPRVQ